MPDVYPWLYRELAEPILGVAYRHSGIFLTPIDFRCWAEHKMKGVPRIAVPIEAVPPDLSVVTDVWDGERRRWRISPEVVSRLGAYWDEQTVDTWFGYHPDRLFWFVPQVAVYAERLPVRAEWVED
ncbi:MAG: hypothetical protein M0Z66_15595 [Thermaerobacter sp.]|nr:hypothetical protein [Thermaerobacter sp.]